VQASAEESVAAAPAVPGALEPAAVAAAPASHPTEETAAPSGAKQRQPQTAQERTVAATEKTKAAAAQPAQKAEQTNEQPALKDQPATKLAEIAHTASPQTASRIPAEASAAPAQSPARAEAPAPAYDPSLRMIMKAGEARVSLDAGGGVSLHVQVQNGVANVRAEGAAAPLLSQNLPDLRAALASSGLSLGGFESGDSPKREQPDGDGAEAPTPAGKPIANTPRRNSKSRLEVEA
jgi:hypothetical protein